MPHDHGGHGGEAADWTDQLATLELEGEVSAPWVQDAIRWLAPMVYAPSEPPVRRIVDVGSGPGIASVLLGQAFPSARVVAYDGNAAFLERAAERVETAGLGERFETRRGHIGPELDEFAPTDLVWAARVIHHLEDPTGGLAQMGRVLRPPDPPAGRAGGLLAVVEGGLPTRVLPGGYGVGPASLISRLDAAVADYAMRRWGMTSDAHGGARDWPLLMAEAGLQHLASRSFLLDLPAPLDDRARDFVQRRFDLEPELAEQLSVEDRAALARLVDPDDPAALVNRPDLFLLSAHTVHVARRAPAK